MEQKDRRRRVGEEGLIHFRAAIGGIDPEFRIAHVVGQPGIASQPIERAADDQRVIEAEEVARPGRPQASVGVERLTRSEEHTSELQSLMRISYAVFCLKKKKNR